MWCSVKSAGCSSTAALCPESIDRNTIPCIVELGMYLFKKETMHTYTKKTLILSEKKGCLEPGYGNICKCPPAVPGQVRTDGQMILKSLKYDNEYDDEDDMMTIEHFV